MLPLQVPPVERVRPEVSALRAEDRPRPAAVEPSVVVDLASPAVPVIPPVTYRGFSRVAARFPAAPELPDRHAALPARVSAVEGRARSPRSPGVHALALPCTAERNLPVVALPNPANCLVPGLVVVPRPADDGEFLEIVDAADGGSETSGAMHADPAGPPAALQRFLLDESGRMQRIIATDPAYAAAVAAFYVSTAALAAVRR